MAPLPKKKHSKGRKGKRSAHFGITAPSLSECPQCHNPKLPHRMCPSCGHYNGREILPLDKTSNEA